MSRRLALAVAVMLCVTGCSRDRDATPTAATTTSSAVSPAGSWSGSISDPVSGDGTAQLSLSDQAPGVLTGTWSATFKNGDSFSGPASASLYAARGYGIMLYVDPQPPCAGPGMSAPLGFTLINVAVTSSRLTAGAGRISCNGPSFGTVNLSKR